MSLFFKGYNFKGSKEEKFNFTPSSTKKSQTTLKGEIRKFFVNDIFPYLNQKDVLEIKWYLDDIMKILKDWDNYVDEDY